MSAPQANNGLEASVLQFNVLETNTGVPYTTIVFVSLDSSGMETFALTKHVLVVKFSTLRSEHADVKMACTSSIIDVKDAQREDSGMTF